MKRSSQFAWIIVTAVVVALGIVACKKKTPTETDASVTFQIDQTSCGAISSSPIVDIFIDGANVGTIYNVDTPGSRAVRDVTVGSHTLSAVGSRGASYGPTVVDVTAAGFTVNLTCTAPAMANVVFQIDQTTCGTGHSSPVVDVFIDGPNVGTIYNIDTPNSRLTFSVTVGNHTLKAVGSRNASYGPTVVSVPIAGFTVNLTCS